MRPGSPKNLEGTPLKVFNGWGKVGLLLWLLIATAHCKATPEVRTFDPALLSLQVGRAEAPLILDVRSANEFAAGHIPNALNIPHDELPDRLSELPRDLDQTIVVHCHAGPRAQRAEAILIDSGYTDVRDLEGHWSGWIQAGRPRR